MGEMVAAIAQFLCQIGDPLLFVFLLTTGSSFKALLIVAMELVQLACKIVYRNFFLITP